MFLNYVLNYVFKSDRLLMRNLLEIGFNKPISDVNLYYPNDRINRMNFIFTAFYKKRGWECASQYIPGLRPCFL